MNILHIPFKISRFSKVFSCFNQARPHHWKHLSYFRFSLTVWLWSLCFIMKTEIMSMYTLYLITCLILYIWRLHILHMCSVFLSKINYFLLPWSSEILYWTREKYWKIRFTFRKDCSTYYCWALCNLIQYTINAINRLHVWLVLWSDMV